jgi:hypothetical protein
MPKLVPLPRIGSRRRVRVRATVVQAPAGAPLSAQSPLPPRVRVVLGILQYWLPAVLIVVVAAALRFVWLADMEFKADERWTYERVIEAKRGGEWPHLGMPTSQMTPNPGMSVWVFIALGWVTGADTPTGLARACQWTNVLAVIGLIAFTFICVPREARGIWLWAAVLVAVNPLAVLLQRKLWPPSVCPLLLLLVLVGFWYRDRRWGAGLWGLVVMIVAQIALAGLFLAAGIALWAVLTERRQVRWRWWLVGSVAGGWPLVPWALEVAGQVFGHPTGQIKVGNVFTFNYWVRWFTEPFGLTLEYSLHEEFEDFLRYPLVDGHATYLMAVVHLALVVTAVYLLVVTVGRVWRERARLGEWLTGSDRNTRLALGGVMFGFGTAITVAALPIHRHYMLLTFPFMYVWLAAIALVDRRLTRLGLTRGQALLAGLVLLQSAATVGFLGYIHSNQRTLRGDYGTPYAAQVQFGLPPK